MLISIQERCNEFYHYANEKRIRKTKISEKGIAVLPYYGREVSNGAR